MYIYNYPKTNRGRMKKIFFLLISILLFSCSQNKITTDNNHLLAVYEENESGEKIWGFIDRDGNYIIDPQYNSAVNMIPENIFSVEKNEKWGIINRKGKIVLNFDFNEPLVFYNNFAKIYVNGLYGFIDITGNIAIEPVFEETSDFIDSNYATVKHNGLWGIINRKGEFEIEPQYMDLKNISEGLAGFKSENGLYGFINLQNKAVIQPQFNDTGFFKDNIAPAKKGSLWGYIDKTGKYIIEPIFESAKSAYDNNLYPVMLGNKWGYINNLGELVINPVYDSAEVFINNAALVKKRDLTGYINSFNKLIWDSSESYYYINNLPENVKDKLISTMHGRNEELIKIIRARSISDNKWLIEVVSDKNELEDNEWIEIDL